MDEIIDESVTAHSSKMIESKCKVLSEWCNELGVCDKHALVTSTIQD